MHFPIYLEIIAAVVIVVIYRSTQHQLFYGMPWSKNEEDFWGNKSYKRKYRKRFDGVLWWESNMPSFPGSKTWLVFLTDWVHLGQWLWLKLFYLIIANHLPLLGSNFITDSLLYSFLSVWAVLGTTLWATEQILKK